MEEEDFLLDLAWKDIENVTRAIENIETKSQIMIAASGILFPLLVQEVKIPTLLSLKTLIFVFPLGSFIFAFFAAANNINFGAVDVKNG